MIKLFCPCGGEYQPVNETVSLTVYEAAIAHQCNECGEEVVFEVREPHKGFQFWYSTKRSGHYAVDVRA